MEFVSLAREANLNQSGKLRCKALEEESKIVEKDMLEMAKVCEKV